MSSPLSALGYGVQRLVAFSMLGGASIVLMGFCALLSLPQFISNDSVRMLIQWSSVSAILFISIFSYPHFIWSYWLAYQQGPAFIMRHKFSLVVMPIALASIFGAILFSWNTPIPALPLLVTMDRCIKAVGCDFGWTSYPALGPLLLATVLLVQTVAAGHHYCMQSYGIGIVNGEQRGFKLSRSQKQILKLNLYALWAMSILSGYSFFALLNNGSFVYHVPKFPVCLFPFACAVFLVTFAWLFCSIYVPFFKHSKPCPPLMAALPFVALYVWLQPFCQPFGFQAWIVPMAHGAQYEYFAGRVELSGQMRNSARVFSAKIAMRLLLLFSVLAVIGYCGFITLPQLLTSTHMAGTAVPNFFFIAAFIFLTLQHYIVDGVVWGQDSRARQTIQHGAL